MLPFSTKYLCDQNVTLSFFPIKLLSIISMKNRSDPGDTEGIWGLANAFKAFTESHGEALNYSKTSKGKGNTYIKIP